MSGTNATVASITLPNFPLTQWRLPGSVAVVDPSQANTGQTIQRTLLIGQMQSVGTATAGKVFPAAGTSNAALMLGPKSMLYQMYARYIKLDPYGEVWLLPLADVGGAATGQIALGDAATAAGQISIYIGGVVENITVSAGDTASTLAPRLAAAITGDPLSRVSVASVTGGVVALQAIHEGALGNDIDLRQNYLGTAGGEASVPGLTVAFTPMSGGTGEPALQAALDTLTARTYDFIGSPYTDTTSIQAEVGFLNDQSGRWSPLMELFGHVFSVARGSYAAQQTLGSTQNWQHVSIMGMFDSPSTVWDWTADLTAVCAASLRSDPGIPVQYLAMNVLAPPDASVLDPAERNALLFDGISTFLVTDAGVVQTENIITTYQTNPAGANDTSYLEVERMFGLTYLIRDARNFFLSNFPNKKLVIDGTTIPPGSNMVTSQTVLQAYIAHYRQLCLNGYAQDPTGFSSAALAQNAGNGVVALLLPFRLVDQLRLTAMLVQFSTP